MARRNAKADTGTASAIEALIQRRTARLYALGDLLRELEHAREAVRTAQEAEQRAFAAALDGQELAVADGWTSAELREAGLYVGAAPVRRRRRPAGGHSGGQDDGQASEPAAPGAGVAAVAPAG